MNDEQEIKKTLETVPSSFTLEPAVKRKTKEAVGIIISKLETEIQDKVYDTEEEYIRDYNLLSYLYWAVEKNESAQVNNAKALGKDAYNLLAVANKTRFYLELNEPSKLQRSFTQLLKMKASSNYDVLHISAKAEIAYCYTRLGFRQYDKAVEAFRNVLEDVKDIPNVDQNLICLWKFGLALTFRRLSHTGNVGSESQAAAADDHLKSAVNMSAEIVESNWTSQRGKGLTYVQMAEAFFQIKTLNKELHTYFPEKYHRWNEEDFYKHSENFCPAEPYILERYGKYLRTQKRLDESEEKLRKAVDIRPTSTAHHHLALTLRHKLLKELNLPPFSRKPYARSILSPGTYQEKPPTPSNRKRFSDASQTGKESHVRRLFDVEERSLQENKERKLESGILCSSETIESAHVSVKSGKYAADRTERKNSEQMNHTFDSGMFTLSVSDRTITSSLEGGETRLQENKYFETTEQQTFEKQQILGASAVESLSSSLKHISITDNKQASKRHGGFPNSTKETSEAKGVESRRVGNGKSQSTPGTKTTHKIRNYRNQLKSPIKVPTLPKHKTKEIIENLDKAVELGDNRAAKYDKGLILRSLQNFDGAIAVFRTLMDEETSLMYLANAYEQCAFCFQDKLSTKAFDAETEQDMIFDQKDFFLKAITIQAKLAAGIPNIKDIYASGITLKQILLGEGKTIANLKELAMLSERLKENSSAIAYYEEIMRMDDNEQKNPTLLMKIATNQMMKRNYTAAVSFFEIVSLLPKGEECINQLMYKQALIEAGFESVQLQQDLQIGSAHLKTVLNPSKWSIKGREPLDHITKEEGGYDIFVLCRESNNEKGLGTSFEIADFLKTRCLLNVTVNMQDVVCGTLKLQSLLSVIDKSNNIVVFINRIDGEDCIFDYCINYILNKRTNTIVVCEEEETDLPGVLSQVPTVVYEPLENNEEKRLCWMKGLVGKLAGIQDHDYEVLYERK